MDNFGINLLKYEIKEKENIDIDKINDNIIKN